MSKVYCGIGDVPKGKRRANMVECAELGQVRYFGLKKIDSRTIDAAKQKKSDAAKLAAMRKKLMTRFVSNKARMKKLENDVKYYKKKEDREKASRQLALEKEEAKQIKADWTEYIRLGGKE